MNISVISTVKNEGEALRPLLDSLIQQSILPDEIIICDGGSTDNTLEILAEYKEWLPLHIIVAPGANISQGRNRAIAAAQGPIIAVTDAGVVLAPCWLEDLTKPLMEKQARVVSGWFEPDPYTDFEVVMSATVLPSRQDIDPDSFLPSSRSVAFLKEAWAEVGGYPEWLDYSEDLLFNMALREKMAPFRLQKRPLPTSVRAAACAPSSNNTISTPRRWQSQLVGHTPRHPLLHLPVRLAHHSPTHLERETGRVALPPAGNRRLLSPPGGTLMANHLGLASSFSRPRLRPHPHYSFGG
ncbi:MAG: glycosyltransferase [Chloroflexi bacterium]|nr:glycosyltransferase [Chloroflexota bacterium]